MGNVVNIWTKMDQCIENYYDTEYIILSSAWLDEINRGIRAITIVNKVPEYRGAKLIFASVPLDAVLPVRTPMYRSRWINYTSTGATNNTIYPDINNSGPVNSNLIPSRFFNNGYVIDPNIWNTPIGDYTIFRRVNSSNQPNTTNNIPNNEQE